MSILTIGGFTPDVDFISVQRTASILDGENAGRLKNGDMSRDIIGTYYNYGFEVEPKLIKLSDYDRLYQMATAPATSHTLDVPFGQGLLSFDAYVAEVSDELRFMDNRRKLWDGMAFTAIAVKPQRYPNDGWQIGSGSGSPGFTLDGVGFDVSVTQLQRKGSVLDSAASGRSMAGVMSREIIGTYYNYSMQIEPVTTNVKEYDSLYYALSAPVDSHKLTVPYGQGTLTFDAYVSTVSDEIRHLADGVCIWGNLQVDFVAMRPERRA